MAIPKQLATSGALQLRRHEVLKLTGSLFKLRRDVNLVSNVLDVPELFWSEASLKELYDAVRDYMEIKPRVQVLNEKLGVASDFVRRGDRASCGSRHPESLSTHPNSVARRSLANPGMYDGAVLSMRPPTPNPSTSHPASSGFGL
ncbi:hypothetical protein EYR36_002672 [Pleurotus pulmonarius]|nr:hypothetical protein EYR36_002672 [Pleurotus pulmonarius]